MPINMSFMGLTQYCVGNDKLDINPKIMYRMFIIVIMDKIGSNKILKITISHENFVTLG